MNATIQKWGNSHGIRLPKWILDQLKIRENDNLEISVTEDAIIMKKSAPKHKNIVERLEEFYQKPIEQIAELESTDEIDTGSPIGDEVW